MLQRFLLVWLTLSSLVAFYWPAWFPGLADPFLATKEHELLKPLFAVTMFAIGTLLTRAEIREVCDRWPTVFGGTAIQYAAMPAIAFAVANVFSLSEEIRIGVILVGCVPGAMASNVLTLAARGNVSYSVSLTTSASLLSPLVVPFVLWLTLGTARRPDPVDTFLFLLLVVVLPVVAGHLASRLIPAVERVMSHLGSPLANATILWIIAVVVGLNRERLAGALPAVLLALLLVNLLGYGAGFAGGKLLRLPEPMRRALTLEVGMQNAGLGTVMAVSFFKNSPAAAIPTAAYTFGCMLTGTLLAQFWASRSAPMGAEAATAAEETAPEADVS